MLVLDRAVASEELLLLARLASGSEPSIIAASTVAAGAPHPTTTTPLMSTVGPVKPVRFGPVPNRPKFKFEFKKMKNF